MTVYGMNAFNPVLRLVLILLLSGAVLTQTQWNAFGQSSRPDGSESQQTWRRCNKEIDDGVRQCCHSSL